MSDRIRALARRLRADPYFLASALDAYARSEQISDDQLAAILGCPVRTLTNLALCRRPRPEPPSFRQDVDTIATRFAVDADALAEVVRRADALAAMVGQGRASDKSGAGIAMAARDRPPEDVPSAEPHDASEPRTS